MKLTLRDDGPAERPYMLETESAPGMPDGAYSDADWRRTLEICESEAVEAWNQTEADVQNGVVRIASPLDQTVNALPEAARVERIQRETRVAHVHAQHREHDLVVVQANPQALAAIADALRLLRHTSARRAAVDLTAADGEGYQLEIARVDADFGAAFWRDQADLPYADRAIDAALARQNDEVLALRRELDAYRRRDLIETLRAISEDVWAAGWLIGIDVEVWVAAFEQPDSGLLDDDVRARLRALVEATGCWPIWDEDEGGPVCVPVADWKRRRNRA